MEAGQSAPSLDVCHCQARADGLKNVVTLAGPLIKKNLVFVFGEQRNHVLEGHGGVFTPKHFIQDALNIHTRKNTLSEVGL